MSADIDDSLAANREDEPVDIGAARRRARAGDRDGYYRIVFVEGKNPDAAAPLGKTCRSCGQESRGGILLQDPGSSFIDRVLCPRCQGEANARIHGYAKGQVAP